MGWRTCIEKKIYTSNETSFMPFRIGIAERDRWIRLMGEAADEVVADSAVRASLMEFFAQVADFMRNTPEEEK